MKYDDILINMLYKFLSLFKITVDEYIKEDVPFLLKLGKKIELYDYNSNNVGYAYLQDKKIIIQVMLENYYLNAVARKLENETYEYKYSILSTNFKDILYGKYSTKRGEKLDRVLVSNMVSIFKNKEFIYKSEFDTLKNTIKLFDIQNKESAFYRNNEFTHSKNNEVVKIINKNGEFEYYVANDTDEKGIYGYSYVGNFGYNYTPYEEEFRKIIDEIDPDYFTLLNNQKKLINTFCDGLFESICVKSLKNYNKNQLKAMLDIDFSTFQKPFVKKLK